jgi:hypothetical protein
MPCDLNLDIDARLRKALWRQKFEHSLFQVPFLSTGSASQAKERP